MKTKDYHLHYHRSYNSKRYSPSFECSIRKSFFFRSLFNFSLVSTWLCCNFFTMDDTSELQLGQIAIGRKLLLSTFILVRKSIWRDKRSYVMIALLPGHFWLFIGYQNGSWSNLGPFYPKGKLLIWHSKLFSSFQNAYHYFSAYLLTTSHCYVIFSLHKFLFDASDFVLLFETTFRRNHGL